MLLPVCCATGKDVWNFHPSGSWREGENRISLAGCPCGYSRTSFHIKTRRLAEAEAAKSMVGPGADSKKSRFTVTAELPEGTFTWIAYMSSKSRRQAMVFPPTENFRPARLAMGPSGE